MIKKTAGDGEIFFHHTHIKIRNATPDEVDKMTLWRPL